MAGLFLASRRRAALLLLLVALLSLCLRVDAASVSRSSAASRRSPTVSVNDDEDEDEDAWDFLSDAAVVAAVDAQKKAVPCAASLDAAYINDDYCDCADSTDEPATSACALATTASQTFFQCASRASDGQRVHTAFLGDGVCDCCDGSDEAAGVCADTCAQRREQKLSELQARLRRVETAIQTREAYAASAESRADLLARDLEQIVQQARALQQSFQQGQQYFEQRMEETGRQPSEEDLHQLRAVYYHMRQWQFKAHVQRKLVEEPTFDPAQGLDAFAALVGQCFPFTVNEKQLKGGSSNVIPREYVVVFCPFQNVTQTEPGYGKWQRAERLSKLGLEDDDNDAEEAIQPPILMGIWEAWRPQDPAVDLVDVDAAVLHQRFDHGEQCVNAQERAVNVDVVCGETNRVLSVEEPEMCVYVIKFETPAACSRRHVDAVEAAITALAQREELTRGGHEEL